MYQSVKLEMKNCINRIEFKLIFAIVMDKEWSRYTDVIFYEKGYTAEYR